MKKKLLGGLLVVAILATAGIVAAPASATEASTKPYSAQIGDGASAQQADASGKPYIGIAITSVPEDSDTDGALIVRVVEGSAADGSLQVNDIITALDDESVDGPRDVVRIVRERSPGDVIVFSVIRDGTSTDISITVGERDEPEGEGKGNRHGKHGYGFFGQTAERIVLSDTRYLTDDGVKTVRKAFGTARNIDAGAGTFDLLLRDDSETLSFTTDEDTKIAIDGVEGNASVADLSADATTMVIEVTLPDGTSQVQFVAQGEFSMMVHSMFGTRGFDMAPRFERGGSDGFSPRKFFFKWRSGNDDDGEGRGRD